MKNFVKKHKISVSVSAFLLIVLPLFYWTTVFAIKKIGSSADLIQEKIIDGNLEKMKIEKIPKMEETNAEFEKNKEAVGTILDSGSKVDFIRYIESLAEETNNKIEIKVLSDGENNSATTPGAKPLAKKDDAKSIEEQLLYRQYVSMQVDLTGDYDGFLNFEHKLENNKYYVNIISLNMQKVFIDKDGGILKENNSNSNGIFLSPMPQSSNSKSSPVSGLDPSAGSNPALKSSLNLIVYTQ